MMKPVGILQAFIWHCSLHKLFSEFWGTSNQILKLTRVTRLRGITSFYDYISAGLSIEVAESISPDLSKSLVRLVWQCNTVDQNAYIQNS